MSGGSLRSLEMKRSNSSDMRAGSTSVMPRQKHTAEFAAEPRPWQRMCRERANRTMSCTVRKYGSYSSSAISVSSCSIASRVAAGTPSGQRWLAPSSVRRRNHAAGV